MAALPFEVFLVEVLKPGDILDGKNDFALEFGYIYQGNVSTAFVMADVEFVWFDATARFKSQAISNKEFCTCHCPLKIPRKSDSA